MPQLIKNETFADGELVTGLRLNNIIDLATLGTQSITAQTAVTTFDIQSTDYLLVYDSSATALRKASIDDIFRSGQTIKVSSISGNSGANLTVGIAGGFAFVINGNTNITGDLVGTGLIQGATGKFGTELTIPSGTTATRPASPLAGSTRFNTDTGMLEVYSGTAWASCSNYIGGSYSLYEVLEFTPTAFTASASGTYQTAWTSGAFTKPANQIWTIELDTTCSTNGTADLTLVRAKYGSGAVQGYDEVWANHFGGSGKHTKHITFKTVVNAGTALTAETYVVEIYASNTPAQCTVNDATYPAKFRIYKYRTA